MFIIDDGIFSILPRGPDKMQDNNQLMAKIEQLALKTWPGEHIDGLGQWKLRASRGHSKREKSSRMEGALRMSSSTGTKPDAAFPPQHQNEQPGIEQITSEQLERTFRTNIFSIFYLVKALPVPYPSLWRAKAFG